MAGSGNLAPDGKRKPTTPTPAKTITATMALPNTASPNRRIGRSVVSGSPDNNADTIRRVTNRYACS
jgi:hypothetical protein